MHQGDVAMAENFDAYHVWLGISPEQQPPDRYRLLGLNRFEDSAEVIDNAADRQMAHLKTVATGKHAARSQDLLNEIAAARVCLQDAANKSIYDAQLKAALATGPQSISRVKPLRQAMPVAPAIAPTQAPSGPPRADPALPVSVVSESSLRRRRKSVVGPLLLVTTVLVVLGVAGFLLWPLIAEKLPVADSSDERTGGKHDSAEPGDAKPPSAGGNGAPTPQPEKASPDEPSNPADGTPSANETAPSVEPGLPTVEPEPPEVGPDPPPADLKIVKLPPAQTEPKKHAVPSDAALKTAEAEINDVFADEPFKTRQEKMRRALTLMKTAEETEDNPSAQYAMFRMSALLAAEQNDLRQADRAVAELHERFEVNALQMRSECFELAAKQAMPLADRRQLVEDGVGLVDEALAADDFVLAGQLVNRLRSELPRVRDKRLAQAVADRRQRGNALFTQFKAASAAIETLETDPDDPAANLDDPAANLSVGRYYCFTKGDWGRGLPHLAKGSDEPIKQAAAAELASPTAALDQLAVADAWFALGQTDAALRSCLARAAAWYSRAERDLLGLKQSRARKRIRDIQAMKLPQEMLRSAAGFRGASPSRLAIDPSEPVPSGRIPTRGLAGYWKFDEGRGELVRDSVAGQPGRLVGCQWDNGVEGKSLRLDGKGYVEFGAADFGDQFTISLWAKPSQKKSMIILLANNTRSFDTGFEVFLNSYEKEDRRFWIGTSNGGRPNQGVASPTGAFAWGQWSHFVVAVDRKAQTARTYINGADVTGDGKTHADFRTAAPWRIGSRMKGGGSYVGYIDELRVYNRVLAAEEIAALARPPAGSGVSRKENKPVELIGRVVLDEHVVAGQWTKDEDGLRVAPHKPGAVLLLPVQVDGAYEFSFELTRSSGLSRIGATIPVGPRQITLVLSGDNGTYHALGPLDGKPPSESAMKFSPGDVPLIVKPDDGLLGKYTTAGMG
jgi:hypothetical protein